MDGTVKRQEILSFDDYKESKHMMSEKVEVPWMWRGVLFSFLN